MKLATFLLLLLGLVILPGCALRGAKPAAAAHVKAHHTVLRPGQVVTFKNGNGSGEIFYVSDFVRRYEIEGVPYDVTLVQRNKEFRHQSGIYNPGESWGFLNFNDQWISRFVVEESVVDFQSMKECKVFLREGAQYYKWVGNEQGYVLGFSVSPGRDQANVSFYRMSLRGKLLRTLPKEYRYDGYVRVK